VPVDSVIAQVDGVTNAVAIESDILGELLMVGPGAGGNATASSVLGDIADIAKSQPGAQRVPVLGHPAKSLEPYRKAQIQSHEGGYFIRLTVLDRTGVFASVATLMAENHISLESIVQRSKQHLAPSHHQTIILVTHATMEDSVRKAVAAIKEEGYLVGEPQVIRIERPKEES
jgi:homoserine dehydrogenase